MYLSFQYLSASYEVEADDQHFFKVKDDSETRETINEFLGFFNKMIGLRILYKGEFVRHLEILNTKRADVGLPHLSLKEYLEHIETVFPEFPPPSEPSTPSACSDSEEPDINDHPAVRPLTPVNKDEPETRQLRTRRQRKSASVPVELVTESIKKENKLDNCKFVTNTN